MRMRPLSVVSSAGIWVFLVASSSSMLGLVNGQQNCTICTDGVSQPPDPNATLSFGGSGTTTTCGMLDSVDFSMDNDPIEDCYLRQLTAYHECGCPTIPRTPQGSCNLCINPEDTPDLDAFSDSYNPRRRCFELAKDAFGYKDDNHLCRETQWKGRRFCGCKVDPTLSAASGFCTMCPDGSAVPRPNKTVREDGTETCAQAAKDISFFAKFPEECPDGWEIGGRLCDCPPATAVCPVCREDSLVSPNATIQLETGETLTCESLFQQGEQGLLEGRLCRFYQYLARESCCGTEVRCQLCEDRNPVPELFESVSTTSCPRYELNIEDVGSKAFCTAAQASVGHLCGCKNPNAASISPSIVCNICGAEAMFTEEALTRATLTGEEHSCIGAVLTSSLIVARGGMSCNDVKLQYYEDCCIPEMNNTGGKPDNNTGGETDNNTGGETQDINGGETDMAFTITSGWAISTTMLFCLFL